MTANTSPTRRIDVGGTRMTDGDAVLAYIPDHEPALFIARERDVLELSTVRRAFRRAA